MASGQFCRHCHAWRGSLGLEPTPELYIEHMVEVFREVKRVLRKDGTLWCNMGDGYASQQGKGFNTHAVTGGTNRVQDMQRKRGDIKLKTGLKPKDLVGMPWRLAFALQQPYYTGMIKDERDRYWLAALVDGEGCFGIRRQKASGNRNPNWNDSFIPYFTIKMSDRAALDKAVRITRMGRVRSEPGKVGEDSRKVRTNRVPYVWRLDGNKATQIARELYPYLVIKGPQAALLHTLDLSNKNKRRGKGHIVPPKVIEERVRILDTVRGYNQRTLCGPLPSWCKIPPALYEPGFYLRSDIIWAKNNPMPESVRDRPTKAHEYVFLLTKAARYFYDADAIREPQADDTETRYRAAFNTGTKESSGAGRPDGARNTSGMKQYNPAGRNRRTVWTIPTQGFPGSHFAVFPTKLVEPMILTSPTKCCAVCGKGWERVTERSFEPQGDVSEAKGSRGHVDQKPMDPSNSWQGFPRGTTATATLGFRPGCDCGSEETMPAVVLDIFCGAGTTPMVALRHSRNAIGLELSEEYAEMARKRIVDDSPLFNHTGG